jgi:two-component system phosphate regulon sensor histidine kinase PhoR
MMLRIHGLGRSLSIGAVLTGISLVAIKLLLPGSDSARALLAATAAGVAGGTAAGLLLHSISGQAREMRARVDSLLHVGREGPGDAGGDEMDALAASLELASRQVRVVVETLRRESSRLESILGSMVEGVVAVDSLLRITFVNRAFGELMGVPLPVAPGTPLVQVVRDHALLGMFTSVVSAAEPLQKRLMLSAAGARSFDVQVAPLAGDPQRGAIAMLYDITELERLERIRKDFVANVSHELRTPLTAISGYSETLLEGALEDSVNGRKFVEIILAKARQLNSIATDLLVLSSLESGKPPAAEPVSLRGSIESALRTVEPAARSRGVSVVLGRMDDLSVVGHDVRLEQVFVNLLENAIKFNRPDGEVRVEIARDAERAVVRVQDTGIGIPSRDLPRIFERFYRVDKARSRSTGGTGLGLAIVKHAVEQMGGSVGVQSDLGHGSVFTVSFPADEAGSHAFVPIASGSGDPKARRGDPDAGSVVAS